VLGDFAHFLDVFRIERDALEHEFRARVAAVMNGGNADDRGRVVAQCWQDASDLEARWSARMRAPLPTGTPFEAGWAEMNGLAGLWLSGRDGHA
jgi:hypothetical protein